MVLRHVVVIALERASWDADPIRELVELVEISIAHEVGPPTTPEPPARFVDQHRHGRHPTVRRGRSVCQVDLHERVVRRAWASIVHGSRVDAARGAALVESVLARHREPHRRYHTVAHVASVLRVIEDLLEHVHVPSRPVLEVAALFHDAVYDPRASDNEARSAAWAVQVVDELGWSADDVGTVRRLVLATAGHEVDPGDVAGAVLLDADLSVLGADAVGYAAYVAGVRAEYAHVDDDAWRIGRAAVLRSFLEREHIFTSVPMRAAREPQARANLGAELAQLSR